MFTKKNDQPIGSMICIPEDDYFRMVRALRMFLDGKQQQSLESLNIRTYKQDIEE